MLILPLFKLPQLIRMMAFRHALSLLTLELIIATDLRLPADETVSS